MFYKVVGILLIVLVFSLYGLLIASIAKKYPHLDKRRPPDNLPPAN